MPIRYLNLQWHEQLTRINSLNIQIVLCRILNSRITYLNFSIKFIFNVNSTLQSIQKSLRLDNA